MNLPEERDPLVISSIRLQFFEDRLNLLVRAGQSYPGKSPDEPYQSGEANLIFNVSGSRSVRM